MEMFRFLFQGEFSVYSRFDKRMYFGLFTFISLVLGGLEGRNRNFEDICLLGKNQVS